MTQESVTAAVAAGVLTADDAHRELLNSVAETSRASSAPRRPRSSSTTRPPTSWCSRRWPDRARTSLIGRRFPSSTGIAGWVLVTRQPLVVEDVTADPRFAADVAADTGYVPKGIMAVPLLHEERSLGVLEVLDRPARAGFTLAEMDLLGCSRTRPRSRSTCSGEPAGRGRRWRAATLRRRRWHGSRRGWTRSRAPRPMPAGGCWRRWPTCSTGVNAVAERNKRARP